MTRHETTALYGPKACGSLGGHRVPQEETGRGVTAENRTYPEGRLCNTPFRSHPEARSSETGANSPPASKMGGKGRELLNLSALGVPVLPVESSWRTNREAQLPEGAGGQQSHTQTAPSRSRSDSDGAGGGENGAIITGGWGSRPGPPLLLASENLSLFSKLLRPEPGGQAAWGPLPNPTLKTTDLTWPDHGGNIWTSHRAHGKTA